MSVIEAREEGHIILKVINYVGRHDSHLCICPLFWSRRFNDLEMMGASKYLWCKITETVNFSSKSLVYLVTFSLLFHYLILQPSLCHIFWTINSFLFRKHWEKIRFNIFLTTGEEGEIILKIYVSRTLSHIFRRVTWYLISSDERLPDNCWLAERDTDALRDV